MSDMTKEQEFYQNLLNSPSPQTIGSIPEGFDALVLADLARIARERGIIYVANNGKQLEFMSQALSFFASDLVCVVFPAWDCLPYDRVGTDRKISAQRIAALTQLCALQEKNMGYILLTSVNAVTQRVLPQDFIRSETMMLETGQRLVSEQLIAFLTSHGYTRTTLVTGEGEFAVRGGIIDLYPPSLEQPVRLDFFGEELETIKIFDIETQRSLSKIESVNLLLADEFQLNEERIIQFKNRYLEQFGAVAKQDRLYESISENISYQGMAHWLPLLHESLESLFDYANNAILMFDSLSANAVEERFLQIEDYYQARLSMQEREVTGVKYLSPEQLYMTMEEWKLKISQKKQHVFSPFEQETEQYFTARQGYNFSVERQQQDVNVFDSVVSYIHQVHKEGRRVFLACWSLGSLDRMVSMLKEHDLGAISSMKTWQEGLSFEKQTVGVFILPLETGFETDDFIVIAEQDILGERLIRSKSAKSNRDVLTQSSNLSHGDLVIHVEHGLGRFAGLEIIHVSDIPHDCLKIIYADEECLFLPVENIELLSRYGSDSAVISLDRLGSANWQGRKARLKNKLRDMAGELIKIAASRAIQTSRKFTVEEAVYNEFSARFPFDETEDQLSCIEAVIDDLSSGKMMDRLICGDVGFGKTEIALRAAFIVAMSGVQVAVVTPTTLLARQHAQSFRERFAGLPVRIGELSRLVSNKDASMVKKSLANGEIDIVIGTHGLLAKTISFSDLGLVIIDEEQHFGVVHKEQLKSLRAQIHVLTLTATPIPRTLQLSLAGLRDLSLITTPPVDRLAIQTFVTPFDAVGIRQALLREKYRGGQSFFICPRISDLDTMATFLSEHVPEIRFVMAHGQMSRVDIEEHIHAFYEGKYDVLLSTSIIESGIDIPSANTMIIYQASKFGLAQLYQMRGRVGRSKLRAYAYMTYNDEDTLTDGAEKRLKVLQSLDKLGAGFTLASHDLDLRGAGNLLGEEQTGHVREVGYELYQSMLEEAIAEQKGLQTEEIWSPQVNLDIPVLLPESYIRDFDIRMGLYRRLANLEDNIQIQSFASELIDRFGILPKEVESLLQIVHLKILCRQVGIERIDAGMKAVVLHFRKQEFSNPAGLVEFLNKYDQNVKLRPDHSLLFKNFTKDPSDRLKNTREILIELAKLV